MDYNIVENEKFYLLELENGKNVRVDKTWVENTQKALSLNLLDTLDMWLGDNGFIENEEQIELDKLAKENKSQKVIKAKADKPKQKTQRERVVKPNENKEFLINALRDCLDNDSIGAIDVVITNKSKLIEFTYNNKQFKLDLIEKRVKKEK